MATKSKQSLAQKSSTVVYDLSATFTAFKSWTAWSAVHDLSTVQQTEFEVKSVHELSAVVYDFSAIVYCI